MSKTTKTTTEKSEKTTAVSLDEMATEIKTEHDGVLHAVRKSLVHARTAGELLSKAKQQVKETEFQWGKWVEKKCGINERTANNYLRIYERWEKIETKIKAQQADLARLTVRAALAMLKTTTRPPKAQQKFTLAVIKERMARHHIEGDPAELVALLKEIGLRVTVTEEDAVAV
jgi:hypothetical protein